MKQYLSFIKKGFLAGAAVSMLAFSAYALKGSSGEAATLPRDCDATAIIHCGSTTISELVSDYNSNDGGRYSDIPAVFNHFGISSSDIQSLGSNYKMGKVHANGNVTVDGQVIGTNALTAGRVFKPGSVAIPGTGAFVRPPSASFSTPTTAIDAFVGYENGAPAWAILTSCGNPVKWDKPTIKIEKSVRNAANTAWVENDTFSNNSALNYRIRVSNPSKVADTNVIVRDTLPAVVVFTKGSVHVNGSAKGAAGDALVSSSGLNIGSLAPGATVEITFQAKVTVAATKCGTTNFTNKAIADGQLTNPVEDTATGSVLINCAVVKCDNLHATMTALKLGQTVVFTATATVQHAVVKSYEFRVNGSVVQNNASNSFNFKPSRIGDYEVKVTVITDKANATSSACAKRITVTQEVAFKCDMITLSKNSIKPGESLTVTAKASTVNSNVLSYEFRVNGEVVQDTANNSYTFTSDKSGTHVIRVTVKTDKGNHTSADCEARVVVSEIPVCPYNNDVPANSPDCKRPEVCPYDESLPKDSPNCKAPESPQVLSESTKQLPDTGTGEVIGVFAAVTILGAVAHRAFVFYRLGR